MTIARLRPLALVAAAALFALTACETTTLQTSWKAPEVGSIKFSKILIIGLAPVESLRRPLEDGIKSNITAVAAVSSYELLPDVKDQVDPKKVEEVIKANGIDGIITMSMTALEDEVTYHAGGYVPTYYQTFPSYYSPGYALSPYYRGFGGPYGAAYGYGAGYTQYEYVPPSVTTDVIMNIETNIYDARTQKLVWTGITTTKNPDDRHNTINEVATVIKNRLREQKLIK